MKVMFYLEPAVFRDDPLMLLPWAGWVARIASANARELSIECAGNAALMEQLRTFSPVPCHALSQAECTGSFGFDRVPYAADLNERESAPTRNPGLFAALEQLGDAARTDLVVSFSQNRYLRRALKAPVLFSEVGALPRSRCRPSLFFDPLGHQRANLFRFGDGLALHQPLTDEQATSALRLFEAEVVAPTLSDPRHAQLREHVISHARGRKVALLALQPPDWITFEGVVGPVAPTDLLSVWASALPAGWAGLVSYHPAHRLPEPMERWLAREHENLIFLPDGQGAGSSELLLPLVDAVVTICSTVGVQGALYGKPVVASSRGAWAGFAHDRVAGLNGARGPSNAERASLILFLTNRYNHPFDRVLDEPGYFAALLADLFRAQFDPKYFFDVSHWQAERAKELLSHEPPKAEAVPPAKSDAVIRVFVGTDDSQIVAHKVLEYSIRKHTERAVEFVPMHNIAIPVPRDPAKRPRTGFSFYRFLIPSLCGYQGRAIYLDADMLVVSDLAELFDTPFEGKALLCTNQPAPPPGWEDNPHFKPGPHYAVMLLDCDRLRWQLDEIVAQLDNDALDYLDLMARMRIVPEEQIGTSLPIAWNSLEHYAVGETKLIHYTVVPTQPWKSQANPYDGVWLDYFREALRAGAVSMHDVQRGIQEEHLHPRLLEIAYEECGVPAREERAPVRPQTAPTVDRPDVVPWLRPLVPTGNS